MLALLASCLAAGAAQAQAAASSDVAGAGMGQGQANINVRSDVTLGIKGERATPTERLEQLTEVVSEQMPKLRKCYHDLIAKHPTTVGSLAIRLVLERSEPVSLELKEHGGTEPELTACVKRVLDKMPLQKVTRPAAALLTLDFQNSRAKGEREMQQRSEAADRVDVRQDGAGFAADWKSVDGKVSFVVSSDSSEAVVAALRAVRDSFPGFADCRRRSEKGGLSPAGVIEAQVQLLRGGKGKAKVTSSTVAHPRAVPCSERVLRGIKFDGAPAGQTAKVQISFSG